MSHLYFLGQILLSTILGGLIGWQREHVGRHAGMRTYALVTLGSTLFTLLSLYGFRQDDSQHIASQILTGIGFLGAGTIIHREGGGVEGLTTAAGLWAMAAVGMAIGAGWYIEVIMVTALMFVILLFRDKKFFN